MKSRGGCIGALVLSALFTVILVSCASTPAPKAEDKEQAWPESKRTDWENKDDPCKEKSGEPRSCQGDQDCCKGFTCTLDPERSRIARFCIEG